MDLLTPAEISGTIVNIVFRNEETGYTVFRCEMKGEKQPVTAVGCTLAREGELVTLRGKWRKDPKYGMQFAAESIIAARPDSPKAIESYLASGIIRGIGPALAKRIVERFGERTLDLMDEDPAIIGQVQGVGPKRVEQIAVAWKEQAASRRIMVFLANQNIGGALALRIFRQYGDDAITVIKANPYRLAREVRGVGFKTADEIARDMGVPETSPQRIEAGVRHALSEATGRGHVGLERSALLTATATILNLHAGWVEPVLDEMSESPTPGFVHTVLPDQREVYLDSRLYEAEHRAAKALKQMAGSSPPWAASEGRAKDIMERAQQAAKVQLAEEQFAAGVMALTQRASILTGGPGTGKTSTLNVILRALKEVRAKVVMGAPTGKAAKRMRETTGHEASTVARLIGMGAGPGEEREIDCDILIIDESSMVDITMLDRVLKCLKTGAAILFVGDVDQLPSVGAGQVLADMIDSGTIPTTRLTKVFRQAQQSAIIRNAHRINHGEAIEPNAEKGEASDFYFIERDSPEDIASTIVRLVSETIPERLGCAPSDVQVLSPMRRSATGTEALNASLQAALNPNPVAKIPRLGGRIGTGDRVLQTVNNYDLGDGRGVMNGESGLVEAIDAEGQTMTVHVDGDSVGYPMSDVDQLTLAYAMTVHKSQGSQFPAVVIPVTTQHYMMLNRSIIYTGVTRATKFCVLVGQRKALEMAIKNSRAEPRLTTLRFRLNRNVASAA